MITDGQIADACNKAYLKSGHNAYFGNGFEAGVKFALEQVKNLSSNPVLVGDSEQSNCVHCHEHILTVKTLKYKCKYCGDEKWEQLD